MADAAEAKKIVHDFYCGTKYKWSAIAEERAHTALRKFGIYGAFRPGFFQGSYRSGKPCDIKAPTRKQCERLKSNPVTTYQIKVLGDAFTAAKWAAKYKIPFVFVREEKMTIRGQGKQVTIGKTNAAKKKIQEWMRYTWREQIDKPGTVISFHPLKSNPKTNPCTPEKYARATMAKMAPAVVNPKAKLKWSTYEGGTFAAPGKKGYGATTEIGNYKIDPISSDQGRHQGYTLRFENVRGRVEGGLHQWIDQATGRAQHYTGRFFRSPNQAKKAAREHYERTRYTVKFNPCEKRARATNPKKKNPRWLKGGDPYRRADLWIVLAFDFKTKRAKYLGRKTWGNYLAAVRYGSKKDALLDARQWKPVKDEIIAVTKAKHSIEKIAQMIKRKLPKYIAASG